MEGGFCACAAREKKGLESAPSITARVVVRFMSMGVVVQRRGMDFRGGTRERASELRAIRGPDPVCYRT